MRCGASQGHPRRCSPRMQSTKAATSSPSCGSTPSLSAASSSATAAAVSPRADFARAASASDSAIAPDLGYLAREPFKRTRVVVEIGRAHERGKLARIAVLRCRQRHDADRLRRAQSERASDAADIVDAGKLAHVVERPKVDAERSCQPLAREARGLDREIEEPLGASLLHSLLRDSGRAPCGRIQSCRRDRLHAVRLTARRTGSRCVGGRER